MKKILAISLLLFVSVCLGQAQEKGDLGAGVVLGDPTGLTGKYWLNGKTAIDAIIGFSGDFSIHADFLWHSWKVLPQPQQGKIAGYLGLGGKIQDKKKDTLLGIRTVAGAAYYFDKVPVEIFS